FDCSVPVISAVGHETDTTIIDFVSDQRAPTPSAAAELAVADIREVLGDIEALRNELRRLMQRKLQEGRMTAKQAELRLKAASPASRIREKKMRLLGMEEQLQHRMDRLLQVRRHRTELYIQRLKGLSPLEKLSSGYSYVSDQKGKNIKSVKQVETGQCVTVRVKDGSFEASVKGVQGVKIF
ncbi:MAG: exodeoxyribonuclease VII large subunit, partial [Acetatifactor sp.]|nr:exodeoxyribonuclease VII large subunit [Acetatifactor sp.]